MKTNPSDKNKDKFNKTTNALSNWPFKQIRKDVTKHPIIQSKESCSNRLGAMWSQQEELIVKGISNSLQCQPREAIRIALYEASLAPHKAHESCYVYAASGSKEPGHTGRNRKGSVALPKSEKDLVEAASKQLGITDKEFVRLAVIWIGKGLRDDSIQLTKTKNISQITLRKEWSKNNPNKPSTIQPLLTAQKKGIERAKEKREEIYNEMKKNKEVRGKYYRTIGSENPGLSYEAHQLLFQSEAQDPFEQLIRDEVERLDLNETEAEVMRYESWGLTHEEAVAAVEEDKPGEPMTCEEYDAMAAEVRTWMGGSDPESSPTPPPVPRIIRNPKPTQEQVNADYKRMIEHEERMKEFREERRAKGEYVDEEQAADSEKIQQIYKRRLNMNTFWDDHL